MPPVSKHGLCLKYVLKLLLATDGRKGQIMSFLEQKIEDYVSNDEEIILECDEMDSYDFPKEEEVPEGFYASMIMGLRPYRDRFNKHYFDVCYKIFSAIMYNQWNEGHIDRISYFYIRQRCRFGSDEERRFRAAMRPICESKILNKDNLVGVIEIFKIQYGKDGVGELVDRSASVLEPDWFVDDTSDEFHQS